MPEKASDTTTISLAELELAPLVILTSYERGFLEAALDSEGYIGLYKRPSNTRYRKRTFTWHLEVGISNTNVYFLEKIRGIVGNGGVSIHQNNKSGNAKPAWSYRFEHSRLRVLLPQLRLVVKEQQRLLAIEFLALVNEHRPRYTPNDNRIEEIWKQLRALNKRGKAPTQPVFP
jgi:hypothetical protein